MPGSSEVQAKLRRLEALERSFQQLLETEKLESLAEFAAGAGHEINNPLAVISGRVQLLLRDERDPERRRELAIINSQALRIHEMIADLMLFARPPKPELAQVDVARLLQALQAELHGRLVEQRVTLEIAAHSGCKLCCDRTQLLVALRAVCDNALDAFPSEGQTSSSHRIEITAQPAEDQVRIVISDNGPGISPEVRRHLFDPLFSGRAAGRGLGMGLAKSWRIVQIHGGTIEVGGHSPTGTTITIVLPTGRKVASD